MWVFDDVYVYLCIDVINKFKLLVFSRVQVKYVDQFINIVIEFIYVMVVLSRIRFFKILIKN